MSEHEEQDERIEDLDVDEEAAEDVKGGVRPASPPSGPVPIPYPN
jgi:hypothetical protein